MIFKGFGVYISGLDLQDESIFSKFESMVLDDDFKVFYCGDVVGDDPILWVFSKKGYSESDRYSGDGMLDLSDIKSYTPYEQELMANNVFELLTNNGFGHYIKKSDIKWYSGWDWVA
jgi:hypothetical protein